MNCNDIVPDWTEGASSRSPVNRYQPYGEPVNDNTILSFGIFAGQKLKDVPKKYLQWYYVADGIKNFWLMQYISKN